MYKNDLPNAFSLVANTPNVTNGFFMIIIDSSYNTLAIIKQHGINIAIPNGMVIVTDISGNQ